MKVRITKEGQNNTNKGDVIIVTRTVDSPNKVRNSENYVFTIGENAEIVTEDTPVTQPVVSSSKLENQIGNTLGSAARKVQIVFLFISIALFYFIGVKKLWEKKSVIWKVLVGIWGVQILYTTYKVCDSSRWSAQAMKKS